MSWMVNFNIGIFIALVSASSYGSLNLTCAEDPLRDQSNSFQQILDVTTPGTTYSLGEGYDQAAVYGQDNRKKVDPLSYPFRTVGKVMVYGEVTDKNGAYLGQTESRCTGTLVGACQVLTAQHCFNGAKSDGNRQWKLKKVEFTDATGAVHVIENIETGKPGDRSQDYAFLKLQSSPGKKLGYAAFLRKTPSSHPMGEKFIVAGYNSDIEDGRFLTADMTAQKTVSSSDPKILSLRADAFVGASGGPVFATSGNGVPYVAGLISQGAVHTDSDTGEISQEKLPDTEKKRLTRVLTTEGFSDKLRNFLVKSPCQK